MPVRFRPATAADVDGIAALHADSWRRNYRGAYPDTFLDNEVWADRTSAWTERLVTPQTGTITIVAELAATVVGLAHMVFDEDPTWGALLDNLHVTHELKGRGVGTRLLSHSAHSLITRTPAASLYLWVLAQNTAAQAFYAARGGQCVERRSRNPEPGDSLRIFWADPSRLIDPK